MEDFKITKDERDTFTNIGDYLQGWLYRDRCVSTVGNKLISLNLTDSLTENSYTFINYFDKATEDIIELKQEPNSFVKVIFLHNIRNLFISPSW